MVIATIAPPTVEPPTEPEPEATPTEPAAEK